MLDRAAWISDIKTRMGYPVVHLAITDDMINQWSQILLDLETLCKNEGRYEM